MLFVGVSLCLIRPVFLVVGCGSCTFTCRFLTSLLRVDETGTTQTYLWLCPEPRCVFVDVSCNRNSAWVNLHVRGNLLSFECSWLKTKKQDRCVCDVQILESERLEESVTVCTLLCEAVVWGLCFVFLSLQQNPTISCQLSEAILKLHTVQWRHESRPGWNLG